MTSGDLSAINKQRLRTRVRAVKANKVVRSGIILVQLNELFFGLEATDGINVLGRLCVDVAEKQ